MTFRITYESCGPNSVKTIIEKEPLEKTPAEPIYPDLIEVFYSIPSMTKMLEQIPQEQLEDAAMEEESVSFEFNFQDLANLGIDIAKAMFEYEEFKRREIVFNPIEHENEKKLATTGKPANNNDPYPVDEKIEELQTHEPFLKIHRVAYCEPSDHIIQLTKEVMNLSDKTEKRLVKLENVVSTMVRYLFLASSRMHINCVYYGGQDEKRKYQCIRCLHDDRISDGQIMTLDQCLNCTRYEPIVGQVYDILDETGQNIKAILDDNQMAYTTMEEYIKLARTEKDYEVAERALIDMKKLTTNTTGEKDFKDTLDKGFEMDWTLVPVEEQKPSVKHEDGSVSKVTESSHANAAFNFEMPGSYSNLNSLPEVSDDFERNENAFGNNFDAHLRAYIENGRTYANSNVDAALRRMREQGYEDILREECQKAGVDPLLMLAIIVVESGGRISPSNDATTNHRGLMQVFHRRLSPNWMSKPPLEKARENIQVGIQMYQEKLEACWNTTNNVLGMTGYNAGEGMIRGVGSRGVKPVWDPGLNQADHNTWTWIQIAPNLERNVKDFYGQRSVMEKMTYYPRIHYVYLDLQEKAGFTPYNNNDMIFMFANKDIGKLTFTSDFGMRLDPITKRKVSMHLGVDLAGAMGIPIVSPAPGVVVQSLFDESSQGGRRRGAGQYIIIQHDSGIHSVYMHLVRNSQQHRIGERVKAGEHIGNLGTTGGSTGPHLHFEVRKARNRSTAYDPKEVYPFLRGQLRKRLKV